MDVKTCCVCKEEKPLVEFYKDSKGKLGRQSRCKSCNKQYYKQDKYKKAAHSRNLVKRFGIDGEQFDAMESEQDGVCYLCQCKSNTGNRLCVDHCHTTGKVRSLLCHSCNTGLGLFMDNPELLRKAADYIEFHQGGV